MGHTNVVSFFLLIFLVTFSLANSHDDPNTLCISECNTCPVICSPPPSPVKLKPPPSSTPSRSSSPSLTQAPPPPPLFAPLRPSGPQPSHSPKSSPPPAYMIYSGAPPPPSRSSCPTPPSTSNIPATQVQPVAGQRNYPYYYYYASKAASLPLHGFIGLGFLAFFHFFCCIYW